MAKYSFATKLQSGPKFQYGPWRSVRRIVLGASLLLAAPILLLPDERAAEAADFVAACERIGPTTLGLVNNEFSPLGKFATWGVEHSIAQTGTWAVDYWITGVTDTGLFNPADGQGYQINANMPWGTFAYWGRDAVGSAVYSSDSTFNIHRVRVDEQTGAISAAHLAGPLDRAPQYIYPSRIDSSPSTYLVYLKALKIQRRTYFEIFWLDSENPTVEHQLSHQGVPLRLPQQVNSNPRWVPGAPVFVYPYVDAGGLVQIASYNVVDGTSKLLTTGAGNKADPFPFYAPEYPGDTLLATVVDTNRIDIYRLASGAATMTLLKTINIPTTLPYEQSAEAFIWQGKTYISTGVNKDPPGSRLTSPLTKVTSELWIADIDPLSSFAQKVNTNAVKWTLDPENLVSPTGVWMYGYQRPPRAELHELQKCRTGLGN